MAPESLSFVSRVMASEINLPICRFRKSRYSSVSVACGMRPGSPASTASNAVSTFWRAMPSMRFSSLCSCVT